MVTGEHFVSLYLLYLYLISALFSVLFSLVSSLFVSYSLLRRFIHNPLTPYNPFLFLIPYSLFLLSSSFFLLPQVRLPIEEHWWSRVAAPLYKLLHDRGSRVMMAAGHLHDDGMGGMWYPMKHCKFW